MKSKQNGHPISGLTVTVVSLLASVSVIIFGILQIFGIWDRAINVCMPLMGITLLCQAYIQWNKSRKIAYFSLGVAVFVFICAIVVFFVK